MYILCKWILCRIWQGCRLIVVNIFHRNAKIFEYFKQCFSVMSECNRSVMRIVFLDQYMAVESSHFRDRKYTDGTEGTCCYRKYFALCHVCADLIVGCRLQTVECDIARCNVSL